jgi:hypothetical protein
MHKRNTRDSELLNKLHRDMADLVDFEYVNADCHSSKI